MRRLFVVAGTLVTAAVLTFLGCQTAGTARLVPATSDTTLNGQAGVVKVIDNVRLEIVPTWTGAEEVTTYSTPIMVTIENNSGKPLMIRYEYFELASEGGAMFVALPVFEVEAGTVPGAQAQVAQDVEPVTDPAFQQSGFAVAPYLASAYPDLPVYDGVFAHNNEYYSSHGTTISQRDLPAEMYRRALPEGVLRNGGRLSGYIFLERVGTGAEAAFLRISLVNARDGNAFSIAAIPFRVVEEEGAQAN
jgi:hypothetical protein